MDEAPKPINLKTQNNHVVTNYYYIVLQLKYSNTIKKKTMI